MNAIRNIVTISKAENGGIGSDTLKKAWFCSNYGIHRLCSKNDAVIAHSLKRLRIQSITRWSLSTSNFLCRENIQDTLQIFDDDSYDALECNEFCKRIPLSKFRFPGRVQVLVGSFEGA